MILHDRNGDPFNLITHLAAMPAGDSPQEWTVRPIVGEMIQSAVPLIRLIAQPLPPDKVEAAQKVRQAASRKQEKLDPRTLIAAGFMVLVTSLGGRTRPHAPSRATL